MENIQKRFFKYVSQNVAGSLGISCYVIADTFFISKATGANGIAVLNLALPLYGIIYAIGALIGVGSATRYGINKARQVGDANRYFSNALLWEIICALPFVASGIFFPQRVIALMGGDAELVELGTVYFRVFLIFSPLFMMQHTFTGFVRNDKGTVVAMVATLGGGLFNILFDYIFMFRLNLGLMGAALATGTSPIVGILFCQIHFHSKKNSLRLFPIHLSFRELAASVGLGVSAFVGEFASAVTTAVFNFIILSLAGNIGVAAYGVTANYAIVVTAIFAGIANGAQPLFSEYYGKGEKAKENTVLRMGILSALAVAVCITAVVYLWTDSLVSIFNGENNATLAKMAREGMRLYFPGYIFAGVNVVLVGYCAATEKVRSAMVTSLLRGAVAIVVFAFLLSSLWGMTGVWCAFAASEATTCAVAIILYVVISRKSKATQGSTL